MILLLDLGNTALKWALSDQRDLSQHGWIEHKDLSTAELEVLWNVLDRPDSVVIASVGSSSAYAQVETLVSKLWNRPLLRLHSQAECAGVRNAYALCADLGIDRWAAIIAARNILSGAFCVVDCGTAITIDLVAADGQHQGGVILPGLATMQDSLLQNTQLPVSKGTVVAAQHTGRLAMASNTLDAVLNGVRYAGVAAIDRIAQQVAQGADKGPSCVITGGNCEHVRPLLKIQCRYEPDLVLKGMNLIVRECSGSLK